MARESDILVRVGLRDENSGKVLKDLQSRIIRFVGAVTASVAAVQAITFPIREAANFERELKNVQKTTGFTDKEIQQLSGSLLDLSRELGISGTELAQISAIAGQLGLGAEGREAVAEFTGVVAEASVALGDTVEKTAEYTAQLSSIFKVPIQDVSKITGVLNEVSNASVATGAQLADIGKRVGDTAGLAITETIALAGFVRELGVPVEQAGTGIVNSLINIQTKSAQVTELLGKDAEEWGATLRANPLDAYLEVTSAIGKIDDQNKQAELIKSLFGTGRQFALNQKIVADSVNGYAKLRQLLDLTRKEFEKGTSASKEYDNIISALTGQLSILRSSFGALVTEAGLGAIDPLVESTQKLVAALQSETAQDFAEGAAKSLANLVSTAGDWVEAITESSDAFEGFLDTLETVGKFIATYFTTKVIANLSKRIARLLTFVGRLGTLFGSLFKGIGAKNAVASFLGLERQVVRTATSAKTMGVAFDTALTKTETELVTITGLIRQLVAQLDALIIKLNASQILANRLAGTTTAAIGAAGAASAAGGTAAFAAQSAAAAASGKVLINTAQKVTPALNTASKASVGFLGALKGIAKFVTGGFLAALRAIPAFLAGPWVGVLTTGVIAWQFFGDDITEVLQNLYNKIREFFGLQAVEFDKSNQKAKEWSRTQRDAVEDAITSYESAITRFRNNFPDPTASVGDLVNDPNIRSDEELTQRTFDKLILKVRNLGDILNTSQAALEGNAAKLEMYRDKLSGTNRQLELLLRKRAGYESFLRLGTPVAGQPDLNQEEAQAAVKQLNNEIAGLTVTQQAFQAVIRELEDNAEDYTQALREVSLAQGNLTFQSNVSAFFDKQILEFARGLRAVIQYKEGLEASEEAIDQINQQIDDANGTEAKENLDALITAKASLVANEEKLNRLYEEQKVANEQLGAEIRKNAGNQLAYTALVNQGKKSLDDTIAVLSRADEDGLLRTANGVAEAFKASKTTLEALANFGALSKLKEGIDDVAESMEHYSKVAKSALDNTNNEISAVERKFQQFATSLRFSQIGVEIDLKFDQSKFDAITDEFETRRQKIIDKYKDILSRALPSEREYWKVRLQNELRSLNNEEKTEKAQLQRKRIQEEFKRISEETARIFDEASKATNVNEFLALKAEGKQGLSELQNIVREAQTLETVDVFGKATQAFKPNEIASLVDRVRNLTTESQADIRTGNENIVRATTEAEKSFQSVANSINEAFTQSKGIVDGLKGIIPNIDKVLESINEITLPELLNDSAGSLQEAAAAIQSVAQQGIGDSFDPSRLEDFLEAIQEGVGPSFAESINQALQSNTIGTSLNTDGISTTVSTATKQGVEDGSKNAKPNIDAAEWQSRIGAVIGEKVYNTKGNLIIEDVQFSEAAKAKLKANLEPFGNVTEARARGGFITGPGTGTSDSILSWLSNGEYVMDAFTTRFFGSSFFSDLQMFARSGRKPKIPSFAQGGLVANAAGGRDVVDLNLTIGGETASLFGEREQVRNLVTNLKRMTRGS